MQDRAITRVEQAWADTIFSVRKWSSVSTQRDISALALLTSRYIFSQQLRYSNWNPALAGETAAGGTAHRLFYPGVCKPQQTSHLARPENPLGIPTANKSGRLNISEPTDIPNALFRKSKKTRAPGGLPCLMQ
ncbi:MAG: hypothetical protein V4772_13045 [Pseudomonadota bacterium]